MKHLRFLSLLIVFAFVLTPIAVSAQDGEIQLEEFVSEDEMLTIGYPEGWTVEENDVSVTGMPGVMLANSEEALVAMIGDETDTTLVEGQAGIAVLLLPIDLLAFMGVQVPAGDEPLDILAVADAFFASTMGEDEEETAEISDAKELELTDEITAGYITVKDSEVEGAMIVFDLGDGVLAIVFGGAYPGEYTDEFDQTLVAVAQSLEYTGTGDDLMTILMGAGSSGGNEGDMSGDTSGDTSSDSTLDGEALVAERCTVCHSADRIDKATKDEAGWTETVDRMIGYGAELNDEERAAVIAYLAANN